MKRKLALCIKLEFKLLFELFRFIFSYISVVFHIPVDISIWYIPKGRTGGAR